MQTLHVGWRILHSPSCIGLRFKFRRTALAAKATFCVSASPGVKVGAARALGVSSVAAFQQYLYSHYLIQASSSNTQRNLMMSELNAVVAVYKTHECAEDAVKKLQLAGIDMRTLSIMGKDSHADEHVVGYYNTGDRMRYWGKTGAFWGGFWGLMFGSAFFAVPGLGPILVAGPLVAWIVGALEGAAVFGGLSAVGAGLYGMGIPKDSVIQYELELKTDSFLLMVHGAASDVEKAKSILEETPTISLALHPIKSVELTVA